MTDSRASGSTAPAIPSPKDAPPERSADSRSLILSATEALLVERGYAGFSIRKLVDRCGLTAPTIYHHFGDKNGLIDALLEARIETLVAELRAVPLAADPVENMRRLFRAFAEFGIQNPTHYELLHASRREQTDAIPAAQEAQAILLEPLEALAAEGRLYTPDLDETRQVAWAFLHGMILLQKTRPDEEWIPNLVDLSLDALLRACIRPADDASRPESSS
jgi:AcrR family transcriptional regulator